MTRAELSVGAGGASDLLCPLPVGSLCDHPLRGGFFDQAHLESLVESIRTNGLFEPVLVRPRDGSAAGYEILAGHYRTRAMRQLRRPLIMGRVTVCDERTGRLIFCTSRMLAKGLTAIEEAILLKEMITSESLSLAAAGSLVGHGKSWVSRRLKLLAALEPELQAEVSRGLVAPRVALELAMLPRGNGDQARVLKLVKKQRLNKEEVHNLVDRWLRADEAEKNRLESGLHQSGPTIRSTPGELSARALEVTARQQLRLAQENLEGLSELVRESVPPVKVWWPAPAWHRLVVRFQGLVDELGPLAENVTQGFPRWAREPGRLGTARGGDDVFASFMGATQKEKRV